MPYSIHPLLLRHPLRFAAAGGALLVCLLGAAMLVRAADDKKPAAAKPTLTITAAAPNKGLLAGGFTATGNIVAWQEAVIGAEINGLRLNDVRANVGDRVSKGQVLATFAAETVEAELAQAKAAVAEAEAALAEASGNAARAKTLEGSGALSAQQIAQYSTAALAAEARLAAARAAVKMASLRLGHTQVLAPDHGTLSARGATLGAVANAGQELFRLVRGDRLEWRAEVTAAELARVSIGQRAVVTTPAGAVLNGRVRAIAPTADPATRNVIVFVDLDRHAAAKAGMFARGEFQLPAAEALTVPQQAVVVRDGFSYVFLVDERNRVAARKIVTGRRAGDRIEIVEGLDPRSRFAVKGAGFLADGDLVAIAPENQPPTGTTTAPGTAPRSR